MRRGGVRFRWIVHAKPTQLLLDHARIFAVHDSTNPSDNEFETQHFFAEVMRADLSAFNLLDSDDNDIAYFYASRLPGEPAEGIEDIHFHVFEPRQVRVYLTYTY